MKECGNFSSKLQIQIVTDKPIVSVESPVALRHLCMGVDEHIKHGSFMQHSCLTALKLALDR